MISKKITSICLLGSLPLLCHTALAADNVTQAFEQGKASLNARLRYESADDDNTLDKASALTLRTSVSFKTEELKGLLGFVEMEDVRDVFGKDQYSPQTPGFDTIADPESTELNQGYLQYIPIKGLTLIGGRQRILLDNQRFVGNVGFRQNEQTFDALTLNYMYKGFALNSSYITQVNGIIPTFDAKSKDGLINLSYQFKPGKLAIYHYDLDHSNIHNLVKFDHKTSGISFTGKTSVTEKIKIAYTAEYAQQTTSTNKKASYIFAETGADFSVITALLGYEELGSDKGTYGFQTPLATKHAFNGWADKFLVTTVNGLQDKYIKLVAPIAGFKIVAMAHNFTDAEAKDSLGSEMDLLVEKALGTHYAVSIKYADFKADKTSALSDTKKLWLTGEMKF